MANQESLRQKLNKIISHNATVITLSVICFVFGVFFTNFIITTLGNVIQYLVDFNFTDFLNNIKTPMEIKIKILGSLFVFERKYLFFNGVGAVLKILGNPFVFEQKYLFFNGVGAVFSLAFAARTAWKIKANFSPINRSQKGSRQWTTLSELKKQYVAIPEKSEFFSGRGGFPVSRVGKQIFIDNSAVNNMIIGTTRSGKGEVFVVPVIDIYSRAENINDRASLIISDPKGELAVASKDTLINRGYNVLIFDLLTFNGLSYNPLEIIKEAYLRDDKPEAQLLTKTLSYIMFGEPQSKDKTWQNWSIALTNALILATVIDCCENAKQCNDTEKEWYKKINMYSVARMLMDLMVVEESDKEKYKIDTFFLSRPNSDIAKMQYAAVLGATGKTKGNIFANTLSKLVQFTMENIAKMTAENTIDLKSIGFDEEKPTAVFLVLPDYDVSNHFVITMFISQLYYVLAKTSSISKGNKCFREVIFHLDEFGNICPIPDFSNIVTVCLGRNIRFNLIIQAYSQIYKLYGQDDAKTIIGNCGNQVYLLTIEKDTAENFSKLIGNETISVENRSGTTTHKSISEQVLAKPLLDYNQLMELKLGECVVVRVTKREDLKRKKITPNPIFNTGKTIMKFRYQYLSEDFDTSKPFSSLNLSDNCTYKQIILDDRIYTPDLPESHESIGETVPVAESTIKLVGDLDETGQEKLTALLHENTNIKDEDILSTSITEVENLLNMLADNEIITQETFTVYHDILLYERKSLNEKS